MEFMYKIKDAAARLPWQVECKTLWDWMSTHGIPNEEDVNEVCLAPENEDGSGRMVKHVTELGFRKLVLFCVFRKNNPDMKISKIIEFLDGFLTWENLDKVEHLESVKQSLMDQYEYMNELIDNELNSLFEEEG